MDLTNKNDLLYAPLVIQEIVRVNEKCRKLKLRYVHILLLMYNSDGGFLKPDLIKLLPYTVNRINEAHSHLLDHNLITMRYIEKYQTTSKGEEIIKSLIYAMRRQLGAMDKHYQYIKE